MPPTTYRVAASFSHWCRFATAATQRGVSPPPAGASSSPRQRGVPQAPRGLAGVKLSWRTFASGHTRRRQRRAAGRHHPVIATREDAHLRRVQPVVRQHRARCAISTRPTAPRQPALDGSSGRDTVGWCASQPSRTQPGVGRRRPARRRACAPWMSSVPAADVPRPSRRSCPASPSPEQARCRRPGTGGARSGRARRPGGTGPWAAPPTTDPRRSAPTGARSPPRRPDVGSGAPARRAREAPTRWSTAAAAAQPAW